MELRNRFVSGNLAGDRTWRSTEFDKVSVRVGDIDLVRGVGTRAARCIFDTLGAKIVLPLVEVIDQQSVVIAPGMGVHRGIAIADEMEFLVFSKPEPGTWKREGGAGDAFELQDFFIEATASRHVLNVQGNMVQLLKFHEVTP